MKDLTQLDTLTAIFQREDAYWLVHLKEEERVHTSGKSIKKAENQLRDALWAWTDNKPFADAVVLEHVVIPPVAVAVQVMDVVARRRLLEDLQATVTSQTAHMAKLLATEGLNRRDVAEILGISHQRVQQLVS